MGSVKESQKAAPTEQIARQMLALGNPRFDLEALEKKMRARIQKLSPDVDRSLDASVRVFIEGVLLWEFGDDLNQDPHFYQMLDEIVPKICENKDLANKFHQLFSDMQSRQR
ncbi:hypothetical protein B0B52_06850 [Polaromonas sp. A23]|nr:hypothetical protein B0B52_06850 [Polaromonas sp. A23]